jgi:hypothetical protein
LEEGAFSTRVGAQNPLEGRDGMKKLMALLAAFLIANCVLVLIAILAVIAVITFWVRMVGMLG